MADQDRIGKLIKAWREHAEQLPKLWPRRGVEAEIRASGFIDCANKLEAVLASPGSVSDQGCSCEIDRHDFDCPKHGSLPAPPVSPAQPKDDPK